MINMDDMEICSFVVKHPFHDGDSMAWRGVGGTGLRGAGRGPWGACCIVLYTRTRVHSRKCSWGAAKQKAGAKKSTGGGCMRTATHARTAFARRHMYQY